MCLPPRLWAMCSGLDLGDRDHSRLGRLQLTVWPTRGSGGLDTVQPKVGPMLMCLQGSVAGQRKCSHVRLPALSPTHCPACS